METIAVCLVCVFVCALRTSNDFPSKAMDEIFLMVWFCNELGVGDDIFKCFKIPGLK